MEPQVQPDTTEIPESRDDEVILPTHDVRSPLYLFRIDGDVPEEELYL